MAMSDRGMTALVDAMAFMIVMMMVTAVTFGYMHSDGDGFSDAGNALDSLCGVEVRISDLTPLEDDTLVYLTDLMAYHVRNGNPQVADYIDAVLEKQCAGRAYCLTISYMGGTARLGEPVADPGSEAVREVPVSAGGTVGLDLRMGS